MPTLTLLALLLTAPCCGDGYHAQSPTATPPPLPAPDYGALRMEEEPLQVWLDLSYGSVTERYDDDGNAEPLDVFTFRSAENKIDSTVDRNAESAALTLQLGGQYDVLPVTKQANLQLGAELSLARHAATFDSLLVSTSPTRTVFPERDQSSGFTPQNLSVSAALDAPAYTVRASYLVDLGPDPANVDLSAGDYWNSDNRDALRLDAAGRFPSEVGYRFTGAASYALVTTQHENEVARPDVLQLRAGVGFRSSDNFEVGATLLFRDELPSLLYGGKGAFSDGVSSFIFAGTDRGRLLSVVPYLAYQAADAPFQIRLKAGFQGEYFDYGYSFWGRDEIAPGLSVTLGITYGIL